MVGPGRTDEDTALLTALANGAALVAGYVVIAIRRRGAISTRFHPEAAGVSQLCMVGVPTVAGQSMVQRVPHLAHLRYASHEVLVPELHGFVQGMTSMGPSEGYELLLETE